MLTSGVSIFRYIAFAGKRQASLAAKCSHVKYDCGINRHPTSFLHLHGILAKGKRPN